ncbi:hypothetical protein Fmac_018863 [Flemingia macrophylla]|uniref:Uncharacterized protein n=1 Tax=Flemingia macrophylla TaxID=520843 RepID=A0ABD1M692_9FABA
MTPFLTAKLAGKYVAVDASGLLISTLQVVLFPVLASAFLNLFFQPIVKFVSPLMPPIAVATVAIVSGSAIAQSSSAILVCGGQVILASPLLHASGFFFGYIFARMLGLDVSSSRTISIEVGMQNAALGEVLATKHFGDPLTTVPCAVSICSTFIFSTLNYSFFLHNVSPSRSQRLFSLLHNGSPPSQCLIFSSPQRLSPSQRLFFFLLDNHSLSTLSHLNVALHPQPTPSPNTLQPHPTPSPGTLHPCPTPSPPSTLDQHRCHSTLVSNNSPPSTLALYPCPSPSPPTPATHPHLSSPLSAILAPLVDPSHPRHPRPPPKQIALLPCLQALHLSKSSTFADRPPPSQIAVSGGAGVDYGGVCHLEKEAFPLSYTRFPPRRSSFLALVEPKRHVSTVTQPHLGLRHGTIDDLAHLASAPT